MAELRLGIFVIGVRSALRSLTLGPFLDRSDWPATYLEPVDLRGSDYAGWVDEEALRLFFGRPLAAGEVGCGLAHRQVYQLADAQSLDWALVCEDDAEMTQDIQREIVLITQQLPINTPTIVSLFAEDADAGRSRLRIGELELVCLRFPPTHTVAYLMNARALRIAAESPLKVMSTADWPPWAAQVEFYLASSLGVKHNAASTIGRRPKNHSRLHSLRRLAAVLSPRAWAMGKVYFPDRRSQFKWTVASPTSKAIRRMKRRRVALLDAGHG